MTEEETGILIQLSEQSLQFVSVFKDAINVYIYILFINAGKKFAHVKKY
jgi:hypothetical protein